MDVVSFDRNGARGDNHQEDSISPDAMQHVVTRGSLEEKFPSPLIIKSTNLRILDPIGQGSSITNEQHTSC